MEQVLDIIKDLIEIVESDVLNGNGVSALNRLGKLKEEVEKLSKKVS